MSLLRTSGVLLTAMLWSLFAGSAVADEQVVAEGPEGGELSAYGGTVAFSVRQPGGGWRLKLWRETGVRTLPIEPKAAPFDVDLGPDEQGRLTVVYSRCRVEPRGQFPGRGCDLYRYANGQEEPVKSFETVWVKI